MPEINQFIKRKGYFWINVLMALCGQYTHCFSLLGRVTHFARNILQRNLLTSWCSDSKEREKWRVYAYVCMCAFACVCVCILVLASWDPLLIHYHSNLPWWQYILLFKQFQNFYNTTGWQPRLEHVKPRVTIKIQTM